MQCTVGMGGASAVENWAGWRGKLCCKREGVVGQLKPPIHVSKFVCTQARGASEQFQWSWRRVPHAVCWPSRDCFHAYAPEEQMRAQDCSARGIIA
eukprot:scaffold178797_cov18-Tisochrysis_lutea.AAC.1